MNLISPVVPNLVIFDLDNTFYNYEERHLCAIKKLYELLSVETSLSILQVSKLFDLAKKNVHLRLGNTASSHSRLLYLNEFFHLDKSRPSASILMRLESEYWETFLSEINLLPDSFEFLDSVVKNNIPTALVTDLTSEIQYRKMEKLGLEKHFSSLITSEDAGGDKLTGRPWELLNERINLDACPVIWYIGDMPHDLNPENRRPEDLAFLKIDEGNLIDMGSHACFSAFAQLRELQRNWS